jgi:glycosyltransferase involved in cell wall biosynthesis
MKVLMVLHQFPPRHRTGTELYAMDLALKLVEEGHAVSVLCADASYEHFPRYEDWTESYRGLDIHYLRASRPLFPNLVLAEHYRPFLGKRFVELLEREAFDVVHFFHFAFLGVSLIEEAWLRDVPSVVHLMDFWTICPRITLLKPTDEICEGPDDIAECIRCMRGIELSGYDVLAEAIEDGRLSAEQVGKPAEGEVEISNDASLPSQSAAARARTRTIRQSLSRASALVAPSKFLKSMLVRNGYAESSMRVLGYAVDEKITPASAGPPSGSKGMRFGYMGSLVPHKGPHVLVEAFRGLDWPEATLTLYGDPKTHREHSLKLRELAAGDARIRFAGPYAREDIRRVHGEIDVLVAPSLWYENTPFVVLEAQAAGIPVVASRLGGLSEIVEDGVSGFTFSHGNPAALAQVLARFRGDAGLWKKLREGIPPVKRMPEHIREIVALYEEARSAAPSAR